MRPAAREAQEGRVALLANSMIMAPISFRVGDRTAAAGVVTTPSGFEIDLVRTPCGVQPDQLVLHAVPLPSARVMHPMHVLESRAANVVHIPRSDEHALKQLSAAVIIAREFTREVLRARGAREAHRLNEWAFKLAASDDSLAVWRSFKIDVLASVLQDPALGEPFASQRYPQMAEKIAAMRRR